MGGDRAWRGFSWPTTTLLFAKEALRLAIARIDKRLR